jgi:glycosyltransferase involved in cell wall biosynthesis
MNPTLSVIVPAYKFEKYITECVDSVLMQNVDFGIEVLIRDDFSGDRTEEIVEEKYSNDNRVRIFKSTENLGAYGNIKFLLENSRGKYASILDGDDYLIEMNKFAQQIEFLETNKNYIMSSTGYKTLLPDGTFDPPEPWFSTLPIKTMVTTDDLLISNSVSFGRVFRNIPGVLQDWMRDFPFLDWAFNYQISLLGKIRCEIYRGGIYRHHEGGEFSLMSKDEKKKLNNKCIKIIKERQEMNKNKTISIIDCFVHDRNVEINLVKAIDRLKENGHDVLLVSNTTVSKEILDRVDYYLYDKRNQLFRKEYENVADVDFWSDHGGFVVHNWKSGLQKHGLSVLINLFNAIDLAKNLGYTHFQRFETDDLYGPESMNWIGSIPNYVAESGKKGMFYLNPDNSPADASFHYFFCEIDYFKEIMQRISSEEDYERYLQDFYGSRSFKIVETYLYDHVIKNDSSDLLVKRNGGDEMLSNFPDTVWNTVVSSSNLPGKYKGCITDIYRVLDSSSNFVRHCVYSSNYHERHVIRKIKVKMEGGAWTELEHNMGGKGAWCLNDLPGNAMAIDVYENDELIYSHLDENNRSYIQLK